MISLLCPTRSRPEKCKRMWDSARQTAYNPGALKLALGIDEGQRSQYVGFPLSETIMILESKDWGVTYTQNMLAQDQLQHTDSKLFFMIADDTIFSTPLWDKALIDHYNALNNKIHVYSLLDSRSPEGTPHPIATREYIQAMGYLSTPIFLHWYVDSWMTEIARANGCFTHLKDYLLIHDKDADRGKPDDTHTRIRERGWHARDSFVNESCQHYLQQEKERLRFEFIKASSCITSAAHMPSWGYSMEGNLCP